MKAISLSRSAACDTRDRSASDERSAATRDPLATTKLFQSSQSDGMAPRCYTRSRTFFAVNLKTLSENVSIPLDILDHFWLHGWWRIGTDGAWITEEIKHYTVHHLPNPRQGNRSHYPWDSPLGRLSLCIERMTMHTIIDG